MNDCFSQISVLKQRKEKTSLAPSPSTLLFEMGFHKHSVQGAGVFLVLVLVLCGQACRLCVGGEKF